jgi:SAM-dependent methyltransferase
VRFNTNRVNRLAFDEVAAEYMARPDVPGGVVAWAAEQAELGAGMRVLEVGAGGGQLTVALRARGLHVTALEPGARLREVLAARLAADGEVAIEGGLFEDHRPSGRYDGVWSANAFHWVDPAVGYERAWAALRPGGALVLIWTYLLVRAPDLAATLRDDVPGGDLTFFCPESVAEFLAGVGASTADGRRQLEDSGLFGSPVWRTFVSPLTIPSGQYPSLVLSYANAAATGDAAQRLDLAARITESLRALAIDEIDVDHHGYAVVARALPT